MLGIVHNAKSIILFVGLNLRFKLVYSVFSNVLYFLTYTQCCRFDSGFDRLAHYGRAATDGRVQQRSAGGRAGGRAGVVVVMPATREWPLCVAYKQPCRCPK
jgi:hypothetical protein